MATRRLSMNRIKYILSLHHEAGYSMRRIARQVGVNRSTVSRTLARFKASRLPWVQCRALSDGELEQVLYGSSSVTRASTRPLPDWAMIQKALSQHSYVTLHMLWLEYKSVHPDGVEYSQFCKLYRDWRRSHDRVNMRQIRRAGERLEMDYSGKRPLLTDPRSGKTRPVELFVAVLGVSHFVYAEATLTQRLEAVCSSVVRCFQALGGVPRTLVPDNMKTVVVSPNPKDVPKINETFQQLADHYGVYVLPTRPGHPKDKAAVEKGVQLVQHHILARLRHRRFFSLGDLNAAIAPLLEELNARPFQKKEGSRSRWFEELDKPALRPLPPTPFRYAQWTSPRKVQFNYHVAIDNSFYSVPYQYVGHRVYGRLDKDTVEIHLNKEGERSIAAHRRSLMRGTYRTNPHHMPSYHQAYAEWTPPASLHGPRISGPTRRP